MFQTQAYLACRVCAASLAATFAVLSAAHSQPQWCSLAVDSHTLMEDTAVHVAGTPWTVTREVLAAFYEGPEAPERREIVLRDGESAAQEWSCPYRAHSMPAGLALWQRDPERPTIGIEIGEAPKKRHSRVWLCGFGGDRQYAEVPAVVTEGERQTDFPGRIPTFLVSPSGASPSPSELRRRWAVVDASKTHLVGYVDSVVASAGEAPSLVCHPARVIPGLAQLLGPCSGEVLLPGHVIHTLGVPLRDGEFLVAWQRVKTLELLLPYVDAETAAVLRRGIDRQNQQYPEPPAWQPTVDFGDSPTLEGRQAPLNGFMYWDVIEAAAGKPVVRVRSLLAHLQGIPVGESVEVVVRRGGRRQTVQAIVYGVRLPDMPGDAFGVSRPRGYCGLITMPLSKYPQYVDYRLGPDRDPEAGPPLVVGLYHSSPAERSGVRLGDVILGTDDSPLLRGESWPRRMTRYSPGQLMRLAVLREGSGLHELSLALTERPHARLPEALLKRSADPQARHRVGLDLTLCDRPWPASPGRAGVTVSSVDAGGPCQAAGIAPGDALLTVDGIPVHHRREVSARLEGKQPNEPVTLKFARNGRAYEVSVPLVETLDEDSGGGTIGLHE